jgi:hypothetical protein
MLVMARTVGKRVSPKMESLRKPSQDERRRLAEINSIPYFAPKGVHRFTSHEEANMAHQEWLVETVVFLEGKRKWKK